MTRPKNVLFKTPNHNPQQLLQMYSMEQFITEAQHCLLDSSGPTVGSSVNLLNGFVTLQKKKKQLNNYISN